MCTGIRNSLSGDRDSSAREVGMLIPLARPSMTLSEFVRANIVPISSCELAERRENPPLL
jgi:hypothetical protein